ncbi:hypothetical protein ACJ2A9_04130 [Anaerobacillus sp. MEB173]|uniref:hypothetical protein n=1 Tax=Anaerobacillus sp. MEB173 TaxID=3383345 RepID=UPI003F8E61D7
MRRILILLCLTFLMAACSPIEEEGITNDKSENEQTDDEQVVEENNKDEETENEQPEEELTTEEIIMNKGEEILELLKEEDFQTLANYVHPEKGLRFSPYGYMTDDDLIFSSDEVAEFFAKEENLIWGIYDGIGTPIELTTKEYFQRFVFDHDYTSYDKVVFNEVIERGNTIKNVREVYPDAIFIEYFIEGTEEYAGMDWRSLHLVFEEVHTGEWYILALIHDEWTT